MEKLMAQPYMLESIDISEDHVQSVQYFDSE